MTAKQMYAQLKERLSPDGKTYLFLDEVQEIKGWEKVVNSLASDFEPPVLPYVTWQVHFKRGIPPQAI